MESFLPLSQAEKIDACYRIFGFSPKYAPSDWEGFLGIVGAKVSKNATGEILVRFVSDRIEVPKRDEKGNVKGGEQKDVMARLYNFQWALVQEKFDIEKAMQRAKGYFFSGVPKYIPTDENFSSYSEMMREYETRKNNFVILLK